MKRPCSSWGTELAFERSCWGHGAGRAVQAGRFPKRLDGLGKKPNSRRDRWFAMNQRSKKLPSRNGISRCEFE